MLKYFITNEADKLITEKFDAAATFFVTLSCRSLNFSQTLHEQSKLESDDHFWSLLIHVNPQQQSNKHHKVKPPPPHKLRKKSKWPSVVIWC